MSMNEASQWRLEIARHVAPIIARHPEVVAVMLGGSASRGHADSYSDIEIGVFWSEAPTDEDRKAPIAPAGGEFWVLDPYDERDDSWMDEWGMGGVKMDVRNLTVAGLERIRHQVMEAGETGEFRQMTLSALLHSIPLHNEQWIREWQARLLPYPDQLREAMVRENFEMEDWCWWAELLAQRGDLPLAYSAFSGMTRQMLAVLLGLNRIYHPGFKWMRRMTDELRIKPPRLHERIEQAYRMEPVLAVGILRDLMLDTYELVAKELPALDTETARASFLRLRPQFAAMPAALTDSIARGH